MQKVHACAALLGITASLAAQGVFAAAAVPEHVDPQMRAALQKTIAASRHGFKNRFDAEVWLLDMSTRLAARMPDPDQRLSFLHDVHAAARKASLSPQLVLAVIQVESNFDRTAVSSAGAQGLMQVMPFWREEIGRPGDNLFNRRTNLRYGCTILSYYLGVEHGNLARALARYNGSPGQLWYPLRVIAALEDNWRVR